jgi:putative ABC transport system permease protein
MFKNYLKTAWRSLIRNKSYTVINITGLAIGIAAGLLIFLVINFETSFDNYHNKTVKIYSILSRNINGDVEKFKTGVPFPTSAALRTDFPQLQNVAALIKDDKQLSITGVNGEVEKFKEEGLYFTEPQLFNTFSFNWLAGDKKSALTAPNTVVLTQTIAEKYFGSWSNAIGKTIRYNKAVDLKVTGILKDVPLNTDLPIQIAVSYSTLKNTDYGSNLTDWSSTFGSHNCFVVLPNNVNESQFNAELVKFFKKYKPDDSQKQAMILQPLVKMHYDTRAGLYKGAPFSKDLINTLSLIGVFLMLIACVNFVNLATAQAVNRSKEVGIRKVLGSKRRQLIIQFISETFIITLFAITLAFFISMAALPALNNLLEIKLTTNFIQDPSIIQFLGITLVTVTLLSGMYPAMVLSGFNPITALKNKISGGKANGLTLRRTLVVIQFGIAQVLVIGTIVIINQVNHFKNYSLGFDKEAVVTVPLPGDSLSRINLQPLKSRIMQMPGVQDVSYSYTSPSDNTNWGTTIRFDNRAEDEDFRVNLKWADNGYFKLYNMEFVAGGVYAKSDTVQGYVINETMAKSLGLKNAKDAIGKTINIWDEKNLTQKIVGVVKDFNVSSLRDQIAPVLMGAWDGQYQTANIKLKPNNVKQTLAGIEKLWATSFPGDIYEYKFLDEKIANFYKKENQLSQLYKIFAGLAIFISCLGLYGMVSFMAVQRTKEVGIRKTLGASVANIVYLFSKEFTVLILIAFVIAAPISWYFMQQWLQGFTYRIHPGVGIFAISILSSICIAWVTVGYKAVRAALVNPVKSLKTE